MISKISKMLDDVADRLEAKGLIKEAYEIDKIADGLSTLDNGRYKDISKEEFEKARVTSYTGGSTWINLNGMNVVVPGKSPVQIEEFFRANPGKTVRSEIYKK